MSIRTFAKHWLPPALALRLKQFSRGSIRFSGSYPNWSEAVSRSTGYDQSLILERVSEAMERVAHEGGYERDSVVFSQPQHSFPVLAGLLRVASASGNGLSVLDFGGSLGSSYLQCREFLSVLPRLTWGIIEQEHFVERGRDRFQTPTLRFHRTIAECVERDSPNVALLSSVLQYLPNPREVIDQLMEHDLSCLIVDRTPFLEGAADMITVQQVPASIYRASYPCRLFSRQRFLEWFRGRYNLVAEFESVDGKALANGVPFTFAGMIFCKS